LEQVLVDLELPATLVVEVEWRLQALEKPLGKIFGIMRNNAPEIDTAWAQ
jgi:hypothetical protein